MTGVLSDAQIDEVLQKNVLGRIACSDKNRLYIVPINYVFDGRNIIAHSLEGKKISMMRSNPQVCFEVDEMKSFTNWRSVIAWGEFEELKDSRMRSAAMKLFVENTMKVKLSETAVPLHARSGGLSNTIVIYRIMLNEKTGRYESG